MRCRLLVLGTCMLTLAFAVGSAHAETARVAAASDLKFAFDELKPLFEKAHPAHKLELIMGSSGKFMQQIDNGAPFDLFFSADVTMPRQLVASGKAVAPVVTYAFGRVVLWSAKIDASQLTLKDLSRKDLRKVAIASPDHAPYGVRAKEALINSGEWPAVQPKLVFGENISHTAQLVDMQAADIGIIALSLAVHGQLKKKGGHFLIPDNLHQPLEQAYVITTRGKDNAAAVAFASFMRTPQARQTMKSYGFMLPGEKLE